MKCKYCNGSGQLEGGYPGDIVKCSDCNGIGTICDVCGEACDEIGEDICEECKGVEE